MVGKRMGGTILLAFLCLPGCSSSTFNCSDDRQCVDNSLQGQCESNGWCSFDDDSCRSGRRYGVQAGSGLAEMCVEADGGSSGAQSGTGQPSTEPTQGEATTGIGQPSTSSTSADTTVANSVTTEGPTDPCDPGTADCDGNPGNGCEADLSDAATCGSCDKSCLIGTPGLSCAMDRCSGLTVIEALDDTRISENSPTENFSGGGVLLVDTIPLHQSLIRVPVFDDLPATAVIESAILVLHCTDPGSTVDVNVVSSSWADDEVTWNSRPKFVDDPVLVFNPSLGTVELDLSAEAQDWVGGESNFGVLLAPNGAGGSDYQSSESDDASLRPSLSLTLTY